MTLVQLHFDVSHEEACQFSDVGSRRAEKNTGFAAYENVYGHRHHDALKRQPITSQKDIKYLSAATLY
jgi:hypothetical protein